MIIPYTLTLWFRGVPMLTVEFIAPFKGHKPGDVAALEQTLAEWLISRQYAVVAEAKPQPARNNRTRKK